MEPIKFRKQNAIYKGNGAGIIDLPCQVIHDGRGRQVGVSSVWTLTEEERLAVAHGANIKIALMTRDQVPPVSARTTLDGTTEEEVY